MDYYREVCDECIKSKSKCKHFRSSFHKDFDKCENIVLSLKDIHINNLDEAFYLHIIEHSKKVDYYLLKCQFKLFFNNYQYCTYVTSSLSDKKQCALGRVFWKM